MCFSLSVLFVSLSFSFNVESGSVAGRERRKGSQVWRDAGREGEGRQDEEQAQAGLGRHGRNAVRGTDGAKGNVANVSNAAGLAAPQSFNGLRLS